MADVLEESDAVLVERDARDGEFAAAGLGPRFGLWRGLMMLCVCRGGGLGGGRDGCRSSKGEDSKGCAQDLFSGCGNVSLLA
jgi:hypothetical protein